MNSTTPPKLPTQNKTPIVILGVGLAGAALVAIVLIILYLFLHSSAPLKLNFRRALLDDAGLVLQVQNTSEKSLACKMVAKNKVLNQRADYIFSVGPYQKTEIGILEANWSFKSGESVEIQVEGHSSVSLTVP